MSKAVVTFRQSEIPETNTVVHATYERFMEFLPEDRAWIKRSETFRTLKELKAELTREKKRTPQRPIRNLVVVELKTTTKLISVDSSQWET